MAQTALTELITTRAFGRIFGLTAFLFSSASAWAYSFDSNVPKDIQAQMTQDLGFMVGIEGTPSSALHQKIYGSVNGTDYLNFFNTRVKAIGLSDCFNASAVACVMPFFDSSKMWITQNYIKFSHPQIARLMVVFHEARHTETSNGNWGHATCPTPFVNENGEELVSIWTGAPLAGNPACDITPFGSYGSSTILLKNIAKNCTNCSEKVRMDADLYAADQLNRITSTQAKDEIVKDIF